MPADIDLQTIAMFLLAFVVAITIHEFGHAIAADLLGDDTPRRQGRVTINPLDHLDPVGTIVLIVGFFMHFGFGWGRPVQIDVKRFKNPRMGDLIVSFAGPLTNLVQAAILGAIMKDGYFHYSLDATYIQLIDIAFALNVTLFVFNLVPIPPLDGSHILAAILPPSMADGYRRNMAIFGWPLFIGFILVGIPLIVPEINRVENILLSACIL
jgi:Zn-dependent protease